jgi:hypothetical protein
VWFGFVPIPSLKRMIKAFWLLSMHIYNIIVLPRVQKKRGKAARKRTRKQSTRRFVSKNVRAWPLIVGAAAV